MLSVRLAASVIGLKPKMEVEVNCSIDESSGFGSVSKRDRLKSLKHVFWNQNSSTEETFVPRICFASLNL